MDFISIQDILDVAMPDGEVQVPEWGGKVRVRALSVREIDRIGRQSTNQKTGRTNNMQLTCMLVEVGCIEPQFAPGQWKALMGKAMGPINRIAERINELGGILGDEEISVICPDCDKKFVVDEAGNPLGEA